MAKKRKQEPEPKGDDHNSTSSDVIDDTINNNNEALSSESEDDDDVPPQSTSEIVPTIQQPSMKSDGRYHNKQRLLVLSSRGITARYRHLLEDLRTLIPHSKKESKLDVGTFYIFL